MSHAVTVKNDFGSIRWTDKWEAALQLICIGADELQMTPEEFVHMMRTSDRECPKCKAGVH